MNKSRFFPIWNLPFTRAIRASAEIARQRHNFYHYSSQSGFGLIDALIGLALIGLVLVFYLGTLGNSSSMTRQTLQRTQALYLAQQIVEELKVNDGRTVVSAQWTPSMDQKTINGTNYVISVTDAAGVAGLETYLKAKRITVSWNNDSDSVSLLSYYYLR